MANILHEFTIAAPPARIFECMTTPAGLDQWWTHYSSGKPEVDALYALGFGPEYDWDARGIHHPSGNTVVFSRSAPSATLAMCIRGFHLTPLGDHTRVSFRHSGWKAETPHFGTTSFAWAMYLRHLRRYVETGEAIPYEDRLEA